MIMEFNYQYHMKSDFTSSKATPMTVTPCEVLIIRSFPSTRSLVLEVWNRVSDATRAGVVMAIIVHLSTRSCC